MASDPQLELRVSRLENDRDSMYDLLTGVITTQQEHTLRFDKMDDRLDKMDDRFDKIDDRLGTIDDQLGTIETTLTEIVRRLPDPS